MNSQLFTARLNRWLMAGVFLALTLARTQANPVDLGQVTVNSIGHRFLVLPPGQPFSQNIAAEFLIEQRQDVHGGATLPVVTANFDTNNQFKLRIAAPPGQKFVVHVPTGAVVQMFGSLSWQGTNITNNGPDYDGTTAVSFENLQGMVPGYLNQSADLSGLHGDFGFNAILSLPITNDISFTAVTLLATVPSTNVGAGTITYSPISDDTFEFYCHTFHTNDPGQFVTLVPLNPSQPEVETINFDDLTDGSQVPAGYGGLQWSDLEVISAQNPYATNGFIRGITSGSNAVFNPYGEAATIQSSNLFDFVTAELTAAAVPSMQIEIQGLRGPTVLYDRTISIMDAGPTKAQYDFAGVDQVKFIPEPGRQFVLDDVTVEVNYSTNPPGAGSHAVNLGQVVVPKVGHTFEAVPIVIPASRALTPTPVLGTNIILPLPTPPIFLTNIFPIPIFPGPEPFPTPRFQVSDYLIDQLQTSGGGGVTPSVTANFDTNNQFVLTISAPPGERFLVHVPPGAAVSFNGNLGWQGPDPILNGPGQPGAAQVLFNDLQGVAPGSLEEDASISQSHRAFGFPILSSQGISNDISFSSITLVGTIPAADAGLGAANYAAQGYNNFYFSYLTTQPIDPGPFISLVSTNPTTGTITNLLTFDDLPDMGIVTNGYGGLNWNDFEVISRTDVWSQLGYQSGVVSPNNVAFNAYGYDTTISSPNPFDFVSAYLTAAVAPNLRVDVQGFVGNTLAYEQTYTLQTNGPTLVHFNFLGVDKVALSPINGSPFVMDNLTVVLHSPTNPPSGASVADLGQVEVSRIEHQFGPLPFVASQNANPSVVTNSPLPSPFLVADYLVSESQTKQGGAQLPLEYVNFDTNNQFKLTITAPPGEKFVVHVPPGQYINLDAFLAWQAISPNPPSLLDNGTTAISFADLQGTSPGYFISGAYLAASHDYFGFGNITSMAITSDISFSSMTLLATVPDEYVGSGLIEYVPSSFDYLDFTYATSQTNDPGPFVFLASTNPTVFNVTNLLTFDDLGDLKNLTNGYGGLDWDNFQAMNDENPISQLGYHSGVVSQPNIVFNPYGLPAAISSSGSNSFDLTSAYLTSVYDPNLQIEVLGYVNGQLTYNHTYTLSTNGPTLIQFNYTGVDQVKFSTIPGGWFAMDNLSVVLHEGSGGGPNPIPITIGSQPQANIAVAPNGSITVTFTGTLQYSTSPNGPYTDVPGNPQGTYAVPKADLGQQRYFRARQ